MTPTFASCSLPMICSAVWRFLAICDLLPIHWTDHSTNSAVGLVLGGQVRLLARRRAGLTLP